MSDNQPSAADLPAPLAGHALITLQGPEAAVFAQAQFANDVAALPTGHWQWNAWLTAKGRVIAVFALLKLAEDDLRLVLPDMPADAFCAQLRRFVFRRRLGIEVAAGWGVSGAFAAPARARGSALDLRDGAIELDHGGAAGPRTLRLAPAGADDAPPAPPADADETARRWRAADLLHGLPRLPEAQRERWTPQQLSLERLHAFSVRKGCYPGQEIVARTHFLGKAKRGLVLLETGVPVAAGAEVLLAEQPVGEVASAATDDDGSGLALAVLPLDLDPAQPLALRSAASAPPDASADAAAAALPGADPVETPDAPTLPARRRPLADGLAR